jgi:hypothetical protein
MMTRPSSPSQPNHLPYKNLSFHDSFLVNTPLFRRSSIIAENAQPRTKHHRKYSPMCVPPYSGGEVAGKSPPLCQPALSYIMLARFRWVTLAYFAAATNARRSVASCCCDGSCR